MGFTVRTATARQILDSRGNPTVEVDVVLASGHAGRAAVPSGASTGSHEAVELRDGGGDWSGKGVGRAVANVRGELGSVVTGSTWASLRELDEAMVAADGSDNKGRFGANAILGVSLATARALAAAAELPLWQYVNRELGDFGAPVLPVPMLNIINGGEHANNGLDVQEFMVVPHGFDRFSDALRAGVAVFHVLKGLVDARGMSTAVGDEGGFAPDLETNEEGLRLVVEAIERAGYRPGEQVSLALDVASTELYRDGGYSLTDAPGGRVDGEGLVAFYQRLTGEYPLVSIEDGASEDDWETWRELTARTGDAVQLVGDDLFVTNPTRLARGIESGVANAMLVKVNQIGTLTETLDAMSMAASAGYRNVMSHRSGETEDPIIADLAVGTACGQIKTGAPSRSDRVAKYNQLLRIEELLGDRATYASPFESVAKVGT